jgi:hypothetical protein
MKQNCKGYGLWNWLKQGTSNSWVVTLQQWRTQEFFRGAGVQQFSWGQREERMGSLGGSPLVRGFAQFANEWKPYSYYVVKDVFSMELRIWPSFVKTAEFRGGGFEPPKFPPRYATALQQHFAYVVRWNSQGVANGCQWSWEAKMRKGRVVLTVLHLCAQIKIRVVTFDTNHYVTDRT